MARGVPLRFFQRIKSLNLELQGWPLKNFQRIKSPNLKSQGVSSYKNFHRIKSQIFARGVFSEIQVPKSQIAGGVPLRFVSANRVPKSQISRGAPLRIFSEPFPRFSCSFLVLLYSGGRRRPNIISYRFKLNYTCGVLRSFN